MDVVIFQILVITFWNVVLMLIPCLIIISREPRGRAAFYNSGLQNKLIERGHIKKEDQNNGSGLMRYFFIFKVICLFIIPFLGAAFILFEEISFYSAPLNIILTNTMLCYVLSLGSSMFVRILTYTIVYNQTKDLLRGSLYECKQGDFECLSMGAGDYCVIAFDILAFLIFLLTIIISIIQNIQ